MTSTRSQRGDRQKSAKLQLKNGGTFPGGELAGVCWQKNEVDNVSHPILFLVNPH